MAVGSRAGLVDDKGHLVDGDRALLADSTATVIGSVLGTSSTTSFVESLTGVEAGGRYRISISIYSCMFLIHVILFRIIISCDISSDSASFNYCWNLNGIFFRRH